MFELHARCQQSAVYTALRDQLQDVRLHYDETYTGGFTSLHQCTVIESQTIERDRTLLPEFLGPILPRLMHSVKIYVLNAAFQRNVYCI